MIVSIVLVLLVARFASSSDATDRPNRAKRIAWGRDYKSNEFFNTQYFIELRNNFACTIEHIKEHKFSYSNCQGFHTCGGSLIHPEFVMTAAHCIMWYEVVFENIPSPESFWGQALELWENTIEYIKTIFILPKPKHTMVSHWSLLAGGTNVFEMTQIRHVWKVHPHPTWAEGKKTRLKTIFDFATLAQDFTLIRACEPFEIDNNVKVAPLPTKNAMQEHYDRIVKEGRVCLYFGMGNLDQDDVVKYSMYPRQDLNTNWTQYQWRSSFCNSGCSWAESYRSIEGSIIVPQHYRAIHEHTCHLCSKPVGPMFSEPLSGDSGGPVVCDRMVVAVITHGDFAPENNYTHTGAYAVHCARNMITKERLEHYKTADTRKYHPLSEAPRFHRRFTDIQNKNVTSNDAFSHLFSHYNYNAP